MAEGSSGKATIKTGVTGGFSSAIVLSATGEPLGVTVSFSPTSITGAGSSTMTITVSSRGSSTGTSTVTITGTGGGKTNKTTLSLTVAR